MSFHDKLCINVKRCGVFNSTVCTSVSVSHKYAYTLTALLKHRYYWFWSILYKVKATSSTAVVKVNDLHSSHSTHIGWFSTYRRRTIRWLMLLTAVKSSNCRMIRTELCSTPSRTCYRTSQLTSSVHGWPHHWTE